MQRGQRDLRGADEVQVVVGQAVDLLLGVGQEAGSVQRALAHEHGRDDRLEALRRAASRARSGRARTRASQGPRAGRQTASPTGARPRSMSIRGPASSRWSCRWRPPRRPRAGPCPRRARRAPAGSAAPRARRRARARTAVSSSLSARPRAPAPLAARAPRGSAGPCGPCWPCSARLAAPREPVRISRQRWSSSSTRSTASAAPGPRRASAARTASGSRRISWMSSTRRAPRGARSGWSSWSLFPVTVPGRSGRCRRPRASAVGDRSDRDLLALDHARGSSAPSRPEYLATNSATSIACCADHDVLRHDRAREAAVLDRVQDPRHRPLAADVEVRAVVELRRAHVLGRAVGGGVGQRVAAAAALVEQHRALVERGLRLRDADLLGPARARQGRDRQQRPDMKTFAGRLIRGGSYGRTAWQDPSVVVSATHRPESDVGIRQEPGPARRSCAQSRRRPVDVRFDPIPKSRSSPRRQPRGRRRVTWRSAGGRGYWPINASSPRGPAAPCSRAPPAPSRRPRAA